MDRKVGGSTKPHLEDIKKKYDLYYPKLVKKLPMDDAVFNSYLKADGLFGNGDLKDIVGAQPTTAQAATKFLDKAISPHIMVDDDDLDLEPLYKLLRTMENFGGAAGTLAKKIKEAISYSGQQAEKSETDEVETSEKEHLIVTPESFRNPSSQGGQQAEKPETDEDRKERKIPKENLLYTVEDLITNVEGSLHKFHEKTLDIQRDKKITDGILLLLMVVNTSEFYAAMYYFNKNKVMVLKSGSNVYYIGKWGKIPAALIRQSEQGVTGPSGSQQVTCSSIKLFENLKVIIALGVCGTMGQLGEVIVSSQIDEYKIKAKGNEFICRGKKYPPGENIYSFLKDSHEIWSFQCTKPETEVYNSLAVFKPILSGTPLVASGEYRDKLIDSLSPEAGGVEMEGIGVIHGIGIEKKKDQIEFIIIKAGCDYADESKNKEWQPVAAMAAANFVYTRLEKKLICDWILGETDNGEPCAKKSRCSSESDEMNTRELQSSSTAANTDPDAPSSSGGITTGQSSKRRGGKGKGRDRWKGLRRGKGHRRGTGRRTKQPLS